jgi:hypothetical protein
MNLSQPFDFISSYALTRRTQRDFVVDKKTGCVYHIVYRSKEHRRSADHNTETLELEIDPNLSPSFSVEEVDLVSGTSITCNLTRLSQPRIGNTTLTMSVFYVDREQTLQESVRTFSMPSRGGSITNRLQLALVAFQKEAKRIVRTIHDNGFTNEVREPASYYASYIALKARALDKARHVREPKILSQVWSDYDPTALNIMLYLYSMLNGDCLHQVGSIYNFSSHFIDSRSGVWHPTKHLYSAEEMSDLDAIMEYYRTNQQEIVRRFSECQESWKFNEEKLREMLRITKEEKI